jgi:hypothetical protein
MSKNLLLASLINYLSGLKAKGRKSVYRTAIYAVMEDRHGTSSIFSGKALTRGLLEDAARAVGGLYLPAKNGNSKVVF